LNEGLKKFSLLVGKIVDEEIRNYALKKVTTYEEISLSVMNIRKKVEDALLKKEGNLKLSSILLPPEEYDNLQKDENISNLILELRDILEGKEFSQIFLSVCDDSFNVFNYKTNHIISDLSLQNKNYMANIIIAITNEINSILDTSQENQYLNEIQGNKDFDTFCLIVYSMEIDF
jgi:hypothetical protein